MVTIIAATGRDRAIGRRGDLAFHIREDMRRFKALTTGHTVVMGRKTFESLPKGALPDRRNIVITRQADYSAPGIECAGSLGEALRMADGEEVFVIGGGEIYRQAIDAADRMELTVVDADSCDADTFFPEFNAAEWKKTAESEPMTDEKSGVSYSFVCYCRI
ncbi:MAG: dihydrofolate reductase [Muribaculaceae bacterium]|nr:dihydrofolate reductase [Muribaculaceae bacterium]